MKKRFKEMIEGIETYDLANSAETTVLRFGEQVIIVAIAILSSTFLGLAVYKIMAMGGLSYLIADLMASTCSSTGIPCEFNSLLGGVGLTLVLLTSFLIATVRIIVSEERQENIFYKNEIVDVAPCMSYNAKQVELLRLIQAMNGINNLRKFANLIDLPYTTAQNYVKQFERDGYVSINSNGQGSRLEIQVVKK